MSSDTLDDGVGGPGLELTVEGMDLLLEQTRFTEKEIREMYAACKGMSVDRGTFDQICSDSAFKSEDMQCLLWNTFDTDDNKDVSTVELLTTLSLFTRGTLEDLSRVFFDMYDKDDSGTIDIGEMLSVFSSLVGATDGTAAKSLTEEQKERLRQFITDADADKTGTLDYEEWAAAVKEVGAATAEAGAFCTAKNTWLVFITAFFEMGTSFALPAIGALPMRMQYRFEATAADIGFAMGVYYAGAIIGPMLGGMFMDKKGPALTVIIANTVVIIGASLQALANGKEQWWLLILGRCLLGCGGDVTPFATVEILNRLFPADFMLMAGIRNLIQSVSNFLSIVILSAVASSIGPENSATYNEGTTVALWLCVGVGVCSLLSNIVVYCMYFRSDPADVNLPTLGKQLRCFARAITPKVPSSCDQLKMPVSLWPVIYGIKAQYFAAYSFMAFSSILFRTKFGMDAITASICTGYLSAMAGCMGPFFGPFSDKYGNRSLMLAAFMVPSVVGFILLATTEVTPWVAMTLFAITYGFGDTVAYPVIRFIVGAERAGLGYGMYGIFGNMVSFFVPVIAGKIIAMEDGLNLMCWYFCAVTVLGILCWFLVRVLETSRGAVELPASKLIETEDADVDAASLVALRIADNPLAAEPAEPKNPHVLELED